MPRFLTLADVAEVLNVSAAQAYALVRGGDIRAIKVGGRGQWRIEEIELEDYIRRMYAETAAFVADPEQASEFPDIGPEVSPEVSPEFSPEVSPEFSPEVSPEFSPEVSPEFSVGSSR